MADTSQNNQILQSSSIDDRYEYQQWKREMYLRRKLDPLVDKLIIEKGRGAIWDVVDLILQYLWKYKRDYMKAVIKEVEKDRELVHNKFASSKDKGIRKLGSIPEEVEILLSRAYLDEVQANSKKFRQEFFRRYPQFRVAEKI